MKRVLVVLLRGMTVVCLLCACAPDDDGVGGAVQQDTPITKPGSDSNPGDFHSPDVVVVHEIQKAIPAQLPCDTEHAFVVRANEPWGVCEDYGAWDVLYAEAIRRGDARLPKISCVDPACPVRNARVTRQFAGCDEYHNPFMEVHYAIRCLPENQPDHPGLGLADPSDIGAGLYESDDTGPPPPPPTETIIAHVYPRGLLACPGRRYFTVLLDEQVKACDKVVDYRPFINKAVDHASDLWSAAACPPGCPKGGLTYQNISWTCVGDVPGREKVTIQSIWFGDCLKP